MIARSLNGTFTFFDRAPLLSTIHAPSGFNFIYAYPEKDCKNFSTDSSRKRKSSMENWEKIFVSSHSFHSGVTFSRKGISLISQQLFTSYVNFFAPINRTLFQTWCDVVSLFWRSQQGCRIVIHRLVHEGPPPFIFPDNPFTLCIWSFISGRVPIPRALTRIFRFSRRVSRKPQFAPSKFHPHRLLSFLSIVLKIFLLLLFFFFFFFSCYFVCI